MAIIVALFSLQEPVSRRFYVQSGAALMALKHVERTRSLAAALLYGLVALDHPAHHARVLQHVKRLAEREAQAR